MKKSIMGSYNYNKVKWQRLVTSMKSLLLLLFLIFGLTANATHYYFSNTGSDAASGTSTGTAWQTITKFNATTFAAGDIISFNGGDVFYGAMVISQSGSAGNPITINSYGTGKPVITGFTTVSAWTNLGSNIWESTSAVSKLNDMNMVVINGVNTAMGRYPNTGYLTYQSHSGYTSITSSSLNSAVTNWTGADVVRKVCNYVMSRDSITAHSGGTLTFAQSSIENMRDGYGFFIENDPRTLDTQNEWYYNPSTKKIRIYSTSSPTNVQVSTVSDLVYMLYRSGITFDGIDFAGSNKDAFYLGSTPNITIQNCNFSFHLYAVWGGNSYGSSAANFNFNHNTLNHINSQAVVLTPDWTGAYVGYNTFKNCGVLPGMFKRVQPNNQFPSAYGAIWTDRTNNLVVEYNSIDSTGFNGIQFTGNNTRINNNEVQHHNMILMDGGGIYTYSGYVTPSTGSTIYNNIVHDGVGELAGTTSTVLMSWGIYLDNNTGNTQVYNNSCFNNPDGGFFSSESSNCNFHDNTFYNNGSWQAYFSSVHAYTSPLPAATEVNDTVKNNIFFSRTSTQLVALFAAKTTDIPTWFNILDSNYYARPIDDSITIKRQDNAYTTTYNYTLAQWKTYASTFSGTTGKDANSNKSPKTITDVNDLRFEYSATSSPVVVSLPYNYMDVKGATYNGTITLAPYTSAVLIKNGM